MSYAADVLIIILSFTAFGWLHSLLASIKIKKLAVRYMGSLIAFYRLTYNLLALIMLYTWYEFVPKPNLLIYDLPYPWDLLTLIPQVIAIGGLIWSTRYFSGWEFAGISQIKRWLNGSYNENDLDEKLSFRADGPYRYSRHPLYFFVIVFFLFRPYMDLFDLTLFLCITAYFYAGSVYEERKLINIFGENYIQYRKNVPRIIPIKFRYR